ncbi:MAG: hypothetical protein CHKLHMKO_00638 [Candidatus Argoarchaeum ethanivorans]|uniref:Uncharacterized protein n=1 Tax=Candidatus Argoarchaeum ethanivorans TaxID=2608793 RepID=A0A811TEJ7_9EURY|nr:MAG: hypothetical protein CHKLHMKO_00638 [Candidatus Argoarchaeum ethanivorans]
MKQNKLYELVLTAALAVLFFTVVVSAVDSGDHVLYRGESY